MNYDMMEKVSVPFPIFRVGNLQLELCEMESPFRSDDPMWGPFGNDDTKVTHRTLRILRYLEIPRSEQITNYLESGWPSEELSDVIAFWSPCDPDFPNSHHLILPSGKGLNGETHDLDVFLQLCNFAQNLLRGWNMIRMSQQ